MTTGAVVVRIVFINFMAYAAHIMVWHPGPAAIIQLMAQVAVQPFVFMDVVCEPVSAIMTAATADYSANRGARAQHDCQKCNYHPRFFT